MYAVSLFRTGRLWKQVSNRTFNFSVEDIEFQRDGHSAFKAPALATWKQISWPPARGWMGKRQCSLQFPPEPARRQKRNSSSLLKILSFTIRYSNTADAVCSRNFRPQVRRELIQRCRLLRLDLLISETVVSDVLVQLPLQLRNFIARLSPPLFRRIIDFPPLSLSLLSSSPLAACQIVTTVRSNISLLDCIVHAGLVVREAEL